MALMLDVNVTSSLATINWDNLNSSVNGKLFQYAPFARACFKDAEGVVGAYDANACAFAQAHYSDGRQSNSSLLNIMSNAIQQNTATRFLHPIKAFNGRLAPPRGESCLLVRFTAILLFTLNSFMCQDWMNPLNEAAFAYPKACQQGSIPAYFVNVLLSRPM